MPPQIGVDLGDLGPGGAAVVVRGVLSRLEFGRVLDLFLVVLSGLFDLLLGLDLLFLDLRQLDLGGDDLLEQIKMVRDQCEGLPGQKQRAETHVLLGEDTRPGQFGVDGDQLGLLGLDGVAGCGSLFGDLDAVPHLAHGLGLLSESRVDGPDVDLEEVVLGRKLGETGALEEELQDREAPSETRGKERVFKNSLDARRTSSLRQT